MVWAYDFRLGLFPRRNGGEQMGACGFKDGAASPRDTTGILLYLVARFCRNRFAGSFFMFLGGVR